MTRRFMRAVEDEREQQRKRWGDTHDTGHTIESWTMIVLRYAGRVGEASEALARTIEETKIVDYDPNPAYPSPRVRADRESARVLRGTAVLVLHRAFVQLAAVCYAAGESLERSRPELFAGPYDVEKRPPESSFGPNQVWQGRDMEAFAEKVGKETK